LIPIIDNQQVPVGFISKQHFQNASIDAGGKPEGSDPFTFTLQTSVRTLQGDLTSCLNGDPNLNLEPTQHFDKDTSVSMKKQIWGLATFMPQPWNFLPLIRSTLRPTPPYFHRQPVSPMPTAQMMTVIEAKQNRMG
jgi:hypothetical protein